MKYFLQTACAAALIGLSGNVYAFTNGVNYDPAHSPDWYDAQQNKGQFKGNSQAGFDKMKAIVQQDLKQISAMGFKAVKTYFSLFCNQATTNGKDLCITDIADLAQTAGLNIMLGVFEFTTLTGGGQGCDTEPDCVSFTTGQVSAAINQATKSNVLGIVVGNEDMFDFSGTALDSIQKRIVDDIKTIKKGGDTGNAISIPVTTAQRQPDWCGGSAPGCASDRTNSLNQSDPHNVLGHISVAGVNIFPYWTPNPPLAEQSCDPSNPTTPLQPPPKGKGQSQALCTQPVAQLVLDALKKVSGTTVTTVIVTEEGWPSCSNSSGTAQNPTDQSSENDYYSTWQTHTGQKFDSYYFAAYDKLGIDPGPPPGIPGSAPPSGTDPGCPAKHGADANNFFGLCDVNGAGKVGSSISCPAAGSAPSSSRRRDSR